jgi:ribosome maturation factor RimP
VRDLTGLFEPVIESMGYELVGVEFNAAGNHGTLRVYIDRKAGVNIDDCAEISHQISGILDVEEPIDDCAEISHQISGILDVEEPIKQAYDLEVSSPGIDRPLFKLADFDRFSGNAAKIKLAVAVQGRKNFKGQLRGVVDSKLVAIEVDGERFDLPYADIARANLVGEL